MSRTIVLTLIVVVLGLTLIACTTGPRTQRYPRYPNYPPYPQGPNYPGYPGQPPGYHGFEQVRNLADDLEEATSEVIEEMETEKSQYQENAIERLEALDNEAEVFRDQVEQTSGSNRDTYRDPYNDPYRDPYRGGQYGDPRGSRNREHFTELLQKYYSARDALKGTPEDDVQRDFARVTRIMRNLTQFYGYRFEPDYDQYEPTIR